MATEPAMAYRRKRRSSRRLFVFVLQAFLRDAEGSKSKEDQVTGVVEGVKSFV